MTKSRANWHSLVAVAAVVGAELEGLKGETYQQLASHTIIFWVCLFCAIIVGYGNSVISTKPTEPAAPSNATPASPLPPAAPAP
jgi:hypothetical protein